MDNVTAETLLAAIPDSPPVPSVSMAPEFTMDDIGWFYYKDEFRVLQPVWKFFLTVFGKDVIESPMSVALFPVVFYFLLVSAITVCDLAGQDWHWIQKYKIQSNKKVTPKIVLKAMKLTFWNHVLLFSPIFMFQYVTGQPEIHVTPLAPGFFEFFIQVFLMLNLFDFQYFVWHYMHHRSRRLYKWCHIVHHEFHSPSVWSTQYLHPWEIFCVGVYNGMLPVMFDAHWLTTLGMSLSNIVISVFAHCGYDLPIDINHFLPGFAGGCRKHDMHHLKPYSNFQPFFTTWDRMMGTECPGMLPGNVRPKELLDWEEKREKKALAWYKSFPERNVEHDD